MEEPVRFWSFDVSALMVLVGESEESTYRFMQRSFAESFLPHPIVGIQCYLRSYDWLLPHSSLTFFSPYSRKSAPLINHRLANFITRDGYLDDGTVTVFKIPSKSTKWTTGVWFSMIWLLISWAIFGGIMLALFIVPNTTWVGIANVIAYSTWSAIVRVIECYLVRTNKPDRTKVTRPDNPDAIYIMGRRDACFVLEGSRYDIKMMTECGLYFWGTRARDGTRRGRTAIVCQSIVRLGTLLLLLFIFTTIPNGSTIDQIIFIVFNILGQLNLLLGQHLNARCLFDSLEKVESKDVDTRTDTFAFLLRRWAKSDVQKDWVSASNLLPETEAWARWKKRIVEDDKVSPKGLYDEIEEELGAELQCRTTPPPTRPSQTI